MTKHPVFERKNNEIVCHLLPHQLKAKNSEKRIIGLVGGRGCGKSVFLSAMALLEMIQGGRIILLAQTYKSLELTLFQEIIDRFTECGLKPEVNWSKMVIKYGNGTLFGFSYENVDSVRGLSAISMLIFDELSYAPEPDFLFKTVNPCLRGSLRKTRIFFGTTPKAGSTWNKWYKENMEDREIYTATMYDNTELTEDELELQKKTIKDPTAYRQEILGEIFEDTVEFCVINEEDYPKEFKGRAGIRRMGIDCSGAGCDYNVFTVVDDNGIVEIVKEQVADTFKLTNIASELVKKYSIETVNIDNSGGFGQGLYDMLKMKQPRCNVNQINFGQAAKNKDVYGNCRAEMYFNLVDRIKSGFYVDDEEIRNELSYTSYVITNAGKTILVPKKTIKELIGHSPDKSDSLALACYEVSDPIYRSPTESLNIAMRFAGI